MTLHADFHSLSPGAYVTLFELDYTDLTGGAILRFTNGKAEGGGDIVWQGNTYTAYPCEAQGFETNTDGSLPRPRLTVSNIDGTLGLIVQDFEDLVGAKLTRHRTAAQYLDGEPGADPTQELVDSWKVEKKIQESREVVSFELASALDVQGLKLPNWIIQASVCTWNNASVCAFSVGGLCDKTVDGPNGCKFNWGATAELPFGGAPGASRIR